MFRGAGSGWEVNTAMPEESEGKDAPRLLAWAITAMAALLAAVVFMLSLTPGVGSEKDRAAEEKNLENMQQLARACLLYADDNGGVLPASLDQLVAETKLSPDILYSPLAKDRSHPSYELAQRGRIFGSETALDPETLFAPAGEGEENGGGDRYEVPANLILIIEREGLRRGARRFVLIDGTPGSLDLEVGPPR